MDDEAKRKLIAERALFKTWNIQNAETNEEQIEHLKNCIKVAINECLTKKQRDVLLLYLSGYNQTEIAAIKHVDKSTICRLVNKALDNIFNHVKYASPITLKLSKKARSNLRKLYKTT